jgi:hypothetical protein
MGIPLYTILLALISIQTISFRESYGLIRSLHTNPSLICGKRFKLPYESSIRPNLHFEGFSQRQVLSSLWMIDPDSGRKEDESGELADFSNDDRSIIYIDDNDDDESSSSSSSSSIEINIPEYFTPIQDIGDVTSKSSRRLGGSVSSCMHYILYYILLLFRILTFFFFTNKLINKNKKQ